MVSSSARADDAKPDYTTQTYSFSIEHGTYTDLLEIFARQAGLDVVGESPSDGTVSLITWKPLTFEEALARIRTLLFHYKSHDPYWLVVHETHIEVLRISDYYRKLPLDRIYAGLEEYQAAALTPNELALLVFKPDNAGSKDLRAIRDFMPDYVRISPLGDGQGAVAVFGLVRDINRYVKLVQKLHKFLETSEGTE